MSPRVADRATGHDYRDGFARYNVSPRVAVDLRAPSGLQAEAAQLEVTARARSAQEYQARVRDHIGFRSSLERCYHHETPRTYQEMRLAREPVAYRRV